MYHLSEFVYHIVRSIELKNISTNSRLLSLAIMSTYYSDKFANLQCDDLILNNNTLQRIINDVQSAVDIYSTKCPDLTENIESLVKFIYDDLGIDIEVPKMYKIINYRYEPIQRLCNFDIFKYNFSDSYDRLNLFVIGKKDNYYDNCLHIVYVNPDLIMECDKYTNQINTLLRLSDDTHHC